MTKQEKIHLKTVMWRILQARIVVSYDDLQELAGVSRSYAQEWMATLIKRDVVEKLSGGRYRLVDESATLTVGQKKLVIHTLGGGQKNKQITRERPEYFLWTAIKEFKSFKLHELHDLNLANKTTTSQYVSLLSRAGFLDAKRIKKKKNKQYDGCYPKRYTVTDKAGIETPLMGRTFYIFDPNTGEYWATPMEKFEERNGLEDARTSSQAQTAT